MAVTCPACRGDFTQSLAGDNQQCLECGAHFEVSTGKVLTESDGGSPLPEPDPNAGPGSNPEPNQPAPGADVEPAPIPMVDPEAEPAPLSHNVEEATENVGPV